MIDLQGGPFKLGKAMCMLNYMLMNYDVSRDTACSQLGTMSVSSPPGSTVMIHCDQQNHRRCLSFLCML